jgi:uncharacterized membrane protein
MRRSALVAAGTVALLLLLLSLLHGLLPPSLTRLGDPVLSVTCHRLPERSIRLPWGVTGLCARCTAFWSGLAAGALLSVLTGRAPVKIGISFLMLLPMIIDGSMQYLGVYNSSGPLRIVTGLVCGLGFAFVLAALSTRGGRIEA